MTPEEPIPLWQGPAREMFRGGEQSSSENTAGGAINNSQVYKAPGTREAVPLPNPHFPGEIAGAEEQQLPRYSIYIYK